MPSLNTPSLKLPTPVLDGMGNAEWAQPSATAGAGGLLSAGGPGGLGSGMSPRFMLESLRMSPGVSGSIAPNADTPKPSSSSLAELFIVNEYTSSAPAPTSSTPLAGSKSISSLPTSQAQPSPPASQPISHSSALAQSQSMPASQAFQHLQRAAAAKPTMSQPLDVAAYSRARPPQPVSSLSMMHSQNRHQSHVQQHQHVSQARGPHVKRETAQPPPPPQQQVGYAQSRSLPMPAALHAPRSQGMSMQPMAYSQELAHSYSQSLPVSNHVQQPNHHAAAAQRLGLTGSAPMRAAPQHPNLRALSEQQKAALAGVPGPGVRLHAAPQHAAGLTARMVPGQVAAPGSSSAIEEAKQNAQEKADKFAQKRKRTRKQIEEEKPKEIEDPEDKNLSASELKKKRYNRRLELNRQSAAVSRVRRRAYVEELEGKLIYVEREKLNLEDQVTVMQAENMKLRDQMRHLHDQLTHPPRPGQGAAQSYPSMPRPDAGKQ